MKKYVLLLSVGPVQSFIASARTSRDLWSGSWLLSEIAKAVAKMLKENQAELIFPFVTDDALLTAGSEFSVGNKIQVVVSADNMDAIKSLAKQANDAAQARFTEEALKARRELAKKQGDNLRENIWAAQIDHYVEVQSSWAAILGDDKNAYQRASERAAQALGSRKATRDFTPSSAKNAHDNAYMIPKSSLDGAHETVLPSEKKKLGRMRQQLRLSDSEQLDTVGIIKRLGGNPEQFTPFTRVTANAWIDRLTDTELNDISDAYAKLVKYGVATNVRGNKGSNGQSVYHKLPFDGQLLYPSRLDAELLQIERALKIEGDHDLNQARDVLKDFRDTILKPIWQRIGQPSSYGVLLLADGDKMGVLLDHADTLAHHQAITQALSIFAGSVAATMRKFNGHTIYAGGDDVLGFVPLHEARLCAEALSSLFNDCLKSVADALNTETPTLSVGLAIAHIMTPLGQIRELAKRAEAVAKGDTLADNETRNALGITLSVRSGSISDMRIRWDDKDALQQFDNWVKAYGVIGADRLLPSRIAYDVREIYLRTNFPTLSSKPNKADKLNSSNTQEEIQLLNNIRKAEFKRMLNNARTTDGNVIPDAIKAQLNARLEHLDGNLEKLSTELIIARWMAMQTAKDIGKH
ncbi:type III-B CRISPR-associated protein Cas10/Cmr2 [Psychrobacter immobilis]|uniref:type III-B CRISPR-associated protein Cas10/Cmr2 n=1 Tax=Psychrobacter immobilis TaxID=498 RepID=UPI001918FB2C|nr:type III-B CRISPR-associated protein Cas10/Cmr2 [Psychrobacter immobilis]